MTILPYAARGYVLLALLQAGLVPAQEADVMVLRARVVGGDTIPTVDLPETVVEARWRPGNAREFGCVIRCGPARGTPGKLRGTTGSRGT